MRGAARSGGRGRHGFFETSVDVALGAHLERPPVERAIERFQDVAASVPAYRAFLAEHGVDPSRVRGASDFAALPMMTKDGYFRRHALAALCRAGDVSRTQMVAVSSGSTGEPTFWPRRDEDELEVAFRFEQVLKDSFFADERRTLAVICFPLGTWVGGMYTAAACRHVAAKGYPITVVTPGNVKDEILRVAGALGPAFDQVVLFGYPPFLKDVVDTARSRGDALRGLPIKLVLAGEVFSEEWRALMAERLGQTEPCFDSASLYGTADGGVLACETPISIAIRRFLAGRPGVARDLFGESRLPTLAQYDPSSRYFEEHEGTLLFTGDGGVPLIRYHISDSGGLFPYGALLERVGAEGFAVPPDVAARGPRELPFVYVFGRSHFTVSFFGANIFPENVTVALEESAIAPHVTGKFVLMAEEDEARDRRLRVVVELAPGAAPGDIEPAAIGDAIVRHLLRLNSEFAHYVPEARRRPDVELAAAGDPRWFPIGVKHRYTRK